MPTPSESIDELLQDEAAAPASSSSDGNSATGRSLSELIEASKHLETKQAGAATSQSGKPKSAWAGLRIARAL